METQLIILRILIPAVSAFILGIAATPFFTQVFYKYKLWKRSSRIDPSDNPQMIEKAGEVIQKIHNKEETKVPRIGGVIVWSSVSLVALVGFLLSVCYPEAIDLHFIKRNQTLIAFASLLIGAGIGLVDDLLQIYGNKKQLAIGIPRKIRIGVIASLGILQGMWFYEKLGYSSISFPFDLGVIELGFLIVPLFMIVTLGVFSSSIIDGVDGLAGGVLGIIFTSYGLIGVAQEQYSIAIFCFVVTGALLAFLWFNIPPARFYLGETGILSLTLPLAVIIFLTNTLVEFIIIGLPLIITALSSIIQIIGRNYFGVRVFKLAPLHHHLEAIGWGRAKITMRYWVFTLMCCALGIILVIAG